MKNINPIFIFCSLILLLSACDGGVSKYDLGAQVIALQPYENMSTDDISLAKSAIEEFYGYDVVILPPITLPEIARKKNTKKKTTRIYHADKLLTHLSNALPDSATKIIGFLDFNIYTNSPTESDYSILAKSPQPSSVSVISTYLLHNYSKTEGDYKSRFRKVVLHEIGHTIGMPHCTNESAERRCLMTNFGGTSRVIDRANLRFCEECAKKINWEGNFYK